MYQFVRLFLATLAVLAVLGADTPSAQDRAAGGALRVAYGDFYPYSYTGPDGRAHGYNIDVTRQLAAVAGYEVEFVYAENPKQFLDLLARGEVDLTPFLALTPERLAAGLATSPLGEYELSVYVRHDFPSETVEGLSGQRVGAVVGSIAQITAEQIPFIEIVTYETSDGTLLPLLSGKLAAVIGVAETFEARLRQNFIEDKVRKLDQRLSVIPYGIIVRRDLPQVHAALERAIAQMADPQLLDPLRDRWFGSDRSIVEHPWFGHIALVGGGILWAMLLLIVYAVRLRRRSAQVLAAYGANTLLIDALDKLRAAIVIFDADMQAIHWNNGFEARFPELVRTVQSGATLEQICVLAYEGGAMKSEMDQAEIARYARNTANDLRHGKTIQRVVHTSYGSTFDVSLFGLGSQNYAVIWVDITELNSQKEYIATQSGELARKNQQLLAFSAMAAHDLKAPLMQQTVLVDFILEDIAEAQLALPAEVQSNFAMLTDLSRRMNVLVGDLLDYATADSDQAETTCFCPNERLEGILTLAAVESRIKVVIMPDMPEVQVSPTSFDLVMRNLITNAAKHHDGGEGCITLRAYPTLEHVVIEVEDDGPGISEANYARVFEPFARLTRVEGTGLGLAFVKKTVIAWGGSITLRSAPVRGVIFSISLPIARGNVIPLTDLNDGPPALAVESSRLRISG